MKTLLVQVDDDLADRLERVVPARSRRRSELIRGAILKALWEAEDQATAEAYARHPDSPDPAFDPTAWEIRDDPGERVVGSGGCATRTDWARVAALSDAEIDTSEVAPLDDSFFARATVRMPNQPLAEVTLHIDPLLLRWFQNQGTQYERLINAALRIYVEAHTSYDLSRGRSG
jgi:uncharacterized protein (DUF4415 family)